MPPVPYRGRRNESAHLPHIAAKIAEIKGISVEEVAAQTTRNTLKMFGLPML
ncbi:MAG: TatD family hydrolase [Rikenellaceae bacterium]|nr:TatD family hydrolase [Rikenellaceae bacterium]